MEMVDKYDYLIKFSFFHEKFTFIVCKTTQKNAATFWPT